VIAAAAATESVRWRAATSISGSSVWRTPPALYQPLDREFSFTIDVAADDANAKCDRFLDRETDALAQSWAGERVFCNPPYGRDVHRWLQKALDESRDHGALVVMVLPARTGNQWFHRLVLNRAEIRFIEGRLNYTLGGGGRKNAPFDSMVVIYRPSGSAPALRSQPCFPFYSRGRS